MRLTETEKLLAAAVIVAIIAAVAYYAWSEGAPPPPPPVAPAPAPVPTQEEHFYALGEPIGGGNSATKYAKHVVCPARCKSVGPEWKSSGIWWNQKSNSYCGCQGRVAMS